MNFDPTTKYFLDFVQVTKIQTLARTWTQFIAKTGIRKKLKTKGRVPKRQNDKKKQVYLKKIKQIN
jgi:hypothetical protein